MGRIITISIKDKKTRKSVSIKTTMDAVDGLYMNHDVNGIMQATFAVNDELNKALDEHIHLVIPDELTTLQFFRKKAPCFSLWDELRIQIMINIL